MQTNNYGLYYEEYTRIHFSEIKETLDFYLSSMIGIYWWIKKRKKKTRGALATEMQNNQREFLYNCEQVYKNYPKLYAHDKKFLRFENCELASYCGNLLTDKMKCRVNWRKQK